MPQEQQVACLSALKKRITPEPVVLVTERDRDAQRKREQRSRNSEIFLPKVVDMDRRERCLADPERFLKTYFRKRFWLDFGKHHRGMMDSIIDIAEHGGRQAIAAPRSSGKSEITKALLVYIVFKGLCRFPVIGAATAKYARRIYNDFRAKIATNPLLADDFPEICWPVRALEGAPQRAGRQHIAGNLTNIVWTTNDYLRFADVEGSIYGGVKLTYFGLDAAIRGINIDGDRPDFLLIDDPETKESAKSLPQIESLEELFDADIDGLAGQDDKLGLVVLTTIQNPYCFSAKITDPKKKPAYNGMRFGMIEQWPDRMDLWEEYIALRHADQVAGDKHGRTAIKFYLDNRDAMDAGVLMLTNHFKKHVVKGEQLVFSAIQQAFNRIADTSLSAYRSEFQNDPEPEEEISTNALTAAKVQARVCRTQRRQIETGVDFTTMGIDIGKYASHWVDTSFTQDAIGTVTDYGVMETTGLTGSSDDKSIQRAICEALEVFFEEIQKRERPPDLVLVDSGTYTDAVYKACRDAGRPFFPSKGWPASKFKMPVVPETTSKRAVYPYLETYASYQFAKQVWLYNISGEYWKEWLQDCFLVSSYAADGSREPGSLALFDPGSDRRLHLSFSQHVVAEQLRLIPVQGKDYKREWYQHSRNNHWLDALALACAAAGCLGVRLLPKVPDVQKYVKQQSNPGQQQRQSQQPQRVPLGRSGVVNQYGRPFTVASRR